jgi:hypothetical protein
MKVFSYNATIQLSPHFNSREFRCKCGKSHEFKIDEKLIEKLEELHKVLNCSKIIITSGFRCSEHDKKVGGSGTGQHTFGYAADFICYNKTGKEIDGKKVSCVCQDLGFKGIARCKNSFGAVHGDMRPMGIWKGDENVNYNTVTSDFYLYYGLTKKDVYPDGNGKTLEIFIDGKSVYKGVI